MSGRATKAELARRLEELAPLVAHCLRPREIRRIIDQKTDWGPTISERTLRRYIKRVWEQLAQGADLDYRREFGALKSRLEREIARNFIQGNGSGVLAANKQLLSLLDLSAAAQRGEEHEDERELARQAREQIAGYLARLAEPGPTERDPQPPE